MATLDKDGYVRIRNLSNVPDKYSTNPVSNFTLPPDADTIVPASHAIMLLGDPTARTTEATGNERAREAKRIAVRVGVYLSSVEAEMPDEVKDKVPLEAYDPDGNRLYMVIDDPLGTKELPTSATGDVQDTQAIIKRMQQLEAELKTLRHQGVDQARADEAEKVEVPDDAAPAKRKQTIKTSAKAADPIADLAAQSAATPTPAVDLSAAIEGATLEVPTDGPSKPKVTRSK